MRGGEFDQRLGASRHFDTGAGLLFEYDAGTARWHRRCPDLRCEHLLRQWDHHDYYDDHHDHDNQLDNDNHRGGVVHDH